MNRDSLAEGEFLGEERFLRLLSLPSRSPTLEGFRVERVDAALEGCVEDVDETLGIGDGDTEPDAQHEAVGNRVLVKFGGHTARNEQHLPLCGDLTIED